MEPSRNFVARSSGFTLIEVMIVVVIVAILASIAYPSYEQYLIKSRRAVAKQFLMDIAQRQEGYFLNVNSYAADWTTLGLVEPEDTNQFYTYAISTTGGCNSRYLLTATAINRQAKDGALTLDACSTKTGKW